MPLLGQSQTLRLVSGCGDVMLAPRLSCHFTSGAKRPERHRLLPCQSCSSELKGTDKICPPCLDTVKRLETHLKNAVLKLFFQRSKQILKTFT